MNGTAPADIAASALGTRADAVVAVEAIKHGLTNESWLVRTNTDAVVVRASNTAEAELRIDRYSEAVVLDEVAKTGIGPEVLLCDPERRLLVTRHMGETWKPEDATRRRNIDRLADILRRLHALAIPAGVRRVDLGSTVVGYLGTLEEHGAHSGLTTQPMRECASQVAQELRKNAAMRLCHNDVHHLNVIDDGEEVRLIDWEYAGSGEPLFDLASVCIYHRYGRAQREQLLSTYGAHTDSITWHRLELACWLFDYIRDLWTAVRELGGAAEESWRMATKEHKEHK